MSVTESSIVGRVERKRNPTYNTPINISECDIKRQKNRKLNNPISENNHLDKFD